MFVFVIKKYLDEKNIKIEELSRVTNMSREYISKLINNEVHDISLSILYQISKLLKIEMNKLYYSIDEYEEVRKELDKKVAIFGLNDPKVKELSNILDSMQNLMNNY